MLLIYGVTGYTGALVVETACAAGLRPTLAGRDARGVSKCAAGAQLETRVFALDDPTAAARALAGASVVLNCAGPFAATAARLADACVTAGVHYLDLAGEVAEYEAVAKLDAAAREKGVMLMPGVGFGVVPTDCVAARLKERLPSATRLTLAFQAEGGVSRGTLRTLVKDLHRPGVTRRNGRLLPAYAAENVRSIDFGGGAKTAVTNPWRGDLVTAHSTTGIPTIETYTVFPPPIVFLMRAGRRLAWLLERPLVRRAFEGLINRAPEGPTAAQLDAGWTAVWGEAADDAGGRVEARLRGPEAYRFTALTAVAVARRVLDGVSVPGFRTPAGVYGSALVEEVDGVRIST